MATKVEELQDRCNRAIRDGGMVPLVQLIAAAKAEERERIRNESQMVAVGSESVNFIRGSVDNYVGAAFLVPVDVMEHPASALIPKVK